MTHKLLMVLMLFTGMLAGCSGSHLTMKDNRPELCPCLPLPNCVSSNSFMFYNSVSPFKPAVPADRAWAAVRETVRSIPRTEIVEDRPGYIHAKCRSRVFRFTDNLEMLLDPDQKTITVRSAASLGIFDFGVNYFRVRGIRKELSEKGIIE